ncbi:hypothetical protein HDU92_007868 [Lobulomyces angularis]|nr:hypothetical protein HDU92_007868 [Lobulomyces angularis]
MGGNKRTNKIFGVKAEEANLKTVKTLAANQGLYNGFLAAGCFWGLIHSEEEFGKQISLFFTCCVFVAAIYGGLTANKKIFFTQGIPALLALVSLYIGI